MRGFFFWEGLGFARDSGANHYAALLSEALARQGVTLDEGDYTFSRQWLQGSSNSHRFLHINWLDRVYHRAGEPPDLERAAERYADFVENLLLARRLGYRLVWTVHNLFPHERPYPQLDRLINAQVAREADHVVTHCRFAKDRIEELYDPPGPVQVIPHGTFHEVFPNEVSRSEARRELGVDDRRFVYLFFGNARGYKGVEGLIDAFRAADVGDALLLLMLRKNERAVTLVDGIERRVAGDRRIMLATSEFFAADRFQYYLNAADVAVLPFISVLTSGSAIQALDFGLPLILPRHGCLPELIDEEMGILYEPAEPGALEMALVQAQRLDLTTAREAVLRRSGELGWDAIAARLIELYRGS